MTGVPVVAAGLADAVRSAIFVLLGAALVLMAGTLALVFNARLRLLPLALALAAAAMTFGALSLAGGDLTMASIAALPVLIGLAVDYAIQFQARYSEAAARGEPEPAVAAVTSGGPTILTAGVATATGFLVLLLSPVPMVRGFGALLVVGIVIALACALCAGFAALTRFSRPGEERPPGTRFATVRGLREHPRVHAAREWLADRSWRTLGFSLARPRRVLAIGIAVAVVGLVLDTQTAVTSDIQELVPQDLPALRDVDTLQKETGVSGEIDVTIRADDITDPKVVGWMTRFQDQVLKAHGFRTGKRCTQEHNPPELCPALSLPDLFSTAGTGQAGGTAAARRRAGLLLAGSGHPGPEDRQPGVRHPADAARPPEGRRGRHQGAAQAATRRRGVRGGPARAGGRGERRPVLAVAPRAHAARRAGRRLPRAARGAPLSARGGGAADPDRARHRLVGPGGVRAGTSARVRSRWTSTRCP